MGFEWAYLVRIVIVGGSLAVALVLAARHGGLAARAAHAVGWSGALLALLAVVTGGEAAAYLGVAALGFGLCALAQRSRQR